MSFGRRTETRLTFYLILKKMKLSTSSLYNKRRKSSTCCILFYCPVAVLCYFIYHCLELLNRGYKVQFPKTTWLRLFCLLSIASIPCRFLRVKFGFLLQSAWVVLDARFVSIYYTSHSFYFQRLSPNRGYRQI